jgi:hypothetical protein
MKKILALSAAALLGSALVSAPALAQVDVGVGVGATTGVTVDTPNNDANANTGAGFGTSGSVGTGGAGVRMGADANTQLDTSTTAAIGADFDSAMNAMTRGSESAATIGGMTEVSTIQVVRVSGIEDANLDAFGTAETENMAGIEELRASLDANAAVKAALDAQSVTASDVVAAMVAADGSLIVYVR